VHCIFCISEIEDAATVCPACQRDLAVPVALLKERDELLRKRDRLASDLIDAKAKIASRTWFGRSSRN
jgi:hypothetical protein